MAMESQRVRLAAAGAATTIGRTSDSNAKGFDQLSTADRTQQLPCGERAADLETCANYSQQDGQVLVRQDVTGVVETCRLQVDEAQRLGWRQGEAPGGHVEGGEDQGGDPEESDEA